MSGPQIVIKPHDKYGIKGEFPADATSKQDDVVLLKLGQ
jgi:hypothetical protein